jgi:hypothetical protein
MQKLINPKMMDKKNTAFTNLDSYRKNLKFRQFIKENIDSVIPGKPTQDYIILKSDEFLNEDKSGLKTICFEVVSVGDKVENKEIKKGTWVQIDPGSRMKLLNWGSQNHFLVREFEVTFVFDRNPEEFEMTAYMAYEASMNNQTN